MEKSEHISKSDCQLLSRKIKEGIYKPTSEAKTTVFFCGADISNKSGLRYRFAEALMKSPNNYQYDIVYPEDIFDELLYHPRSGNLLTLEELLAESVDAIVMIPESPGSLAELGAFANNEDLRTKMICLIDKKFKTKRSFINQGPVKLVRKANPKGILFVNPVDITKDVHDLSSALRNTKRRSSTSSQHITLLQLDNFLLPSIYLFEPVSKDTLVNLVAPVIRNDLKAFSATIVALTILMKKRFVELHDSHYRLTELGVSEFFRLHRIKRRVKIHGGTVALDSLRLEILNMKLRVKRLRA